MSEVSLYDDDPPMKSRTLSLNHSLEPHAPSPKSPNTATVITTNPKP